MTQHFTAILYKEARLGGKTDGIAYGSQVSMWETGGMEPMATNFLRWANAIGCDVLLAPRRELPEEHDVESDIEPEWSHA